MDSKNRLDFARDLLVKLYNEHAKLSDEELLDMMYDFLMGKEHSKYLLAEKLCYTYEIRPEELELYRHDMIIDIIFTVYQYWRYVKTMHATSPLEEEIMSELEDLPFSIGQLQGYFHDAKNELKVRTLLLDYFVYTTQPKQFILDCQEYIQEEPTIFYDELARYESYIGVLDEIALIYDDVYAKYHPEEEEESYSFDLVYLNEDEELDEEELEEEISSELEILEQVQQELFETILNYLEDVYQDKDDIDDFIGFFMSYVYAFLCQAKQTPITKDGQQMATSVLTIEDEELLKLLNHPDANFEVITESFWCNKEYVFDCVEFFCREYFLRGGKIFEEREKIQDRNAQKRIEMMDPLYTKPQVELNILYVGKPIARIFDQLLMEVKRNHPVDYTEEIYEIAMNAQKAEEAFKPYELSKVGMKHYQNLLMRYLSRKYLEKVIIKVWLSLLLDLGE